MSLKSYGDVILVIGVLPFIIFEKCQIKNRQKD